MGDDAAAIARSNFKNTATNFKRLLGRQYREPEVQAELARMPGVAFEEMENGTVGIRVNYNDEVKGLVLRLMNLNEGTFSKVDEISFPN